MAINRLHNALEQVYDAVKTIENDDRATRIRRFLVDLLHKEESNFNFTDPNHPFTRFAKRRETEGNRLRLFQAVQELITEDEEDLQPAVDMMFETPDTAPYSAVQTLLRRYLAYANSRRAGSDSDSDSD
jgi:hypothetical protein